MIPSAKVAYLSIDSYSILLLLLPQQIDISSDLSIDSLQNPLRTMSARLLAPRSCIKHCNSTAAGWSIQISFSWNLHWNYTRTYFRLASKTTTAHCIDWSHWSITLKSHRFLCQMCYSLEFHISPYRSVTAIASGKYYLIIPSSTLQVSPPLTFPH